MQLETFALVIIVGEADEVGGVEAVNQQREKQRDCRHSHQQFGCAIHIRLSRLVAERDKRNANQAHRRQNQKRDRLRRSNAALATDIQNVNREHPDEADAAQQRQSFTQLSFGHGRVFAIHSRSVDRLAFAFKFE